MGFAVHKEGGIHYYARDQHSNQRVEAEVATWKKAEVNELDHLGGFDEVFGNIGNKDSIDNQLW